MPLKLGSKHRLPIHAGSPSIPASRGLIFFVGQSCLSSSSFTFLEVCKPKNALPPETGLTCGVSDYAKSFSPLFFFFF